MSGLPSVLSNLLQDGDLVLTQGAGDIGKVAKQLEQMKLNIQVMKNS
ncbi:UDP-N-acetylmuramate-alanine ligase [Vibrio variabilis]|nr:UDP-N-acetylmuramate-alanine ligase [Vibrio variabilis]